MVLGRPRINTDDEYIRDAYLNFSDVQAIAERECTRLKLKVSTGTIMNRIRDMGIVRVGGGVL